GVTRHRRVLDTDAAPAALGLDPPECGLGSRHRHAEPRRVRHLVEAVREYLRPDDQRLEQDGVTGVHIRVHTMATTEERSRDSSKSVSPSLSPASASRSRSSPTVKGWNVIGYSRVSA